MHILRDGCFSGRERDTVHDDDDDDDHDSSDSNSAFGTLLFSVCSCFYYDIFESFSRLFPFHFYSFCFPPSYEYFLEFSGSNINGGRFLQHAGQRNGGGNGHYRSWDLGYCCIAFILLIKP